MTPKGRIRHRVIGAMIAIGITGAEETAGAMSPGRIPAVPTSNPRPVINDESVIIPARKADESETLLCLDFEQLRKIEYAIEELPAKKKVQRIATTLTEARMQQLHIYQTWELATRVMADLAGVQIEDCAAWIWAMYTIAQLWKQQIECTVSGLRASVSGIMNDMAHDMNGA
ncbi:MAG: hypothetical protein LBD43_02845, partial [Holosporales bacterium]|nr:hypothetical protein [Holosporales bacterium]